MDSVAVTGAGGGIGLHVVHAAIERGARTLWLIDRDHEGLRAARAQIPGDRDVRVLDLDVTDRDGVAALGQEWQAGGAPDLVVNCVGIRHVASLTDTSDDEWDDTIAVNLSGIFFVMRAAATAMQSQGSAGVIVNIASVAADVGFSERAAYCASKAGLLGLTRAAATDLAADDIRVLAVSPGYHRTGLSHAADEATIASRIPLGRSGDPRELAELILNLAQSSFITGSNIIVDGGALASGEA